MTVFTKQLCDLLILEFCPCYFLSEQSKNATLLLFRKALECIDKCLVHREKKIIF